MPATVRVRDRFDLPEQIRKGDFVLKLTEGVSHARETVDSCVVTPALADAFDRTTTRAARYTWTATSSSNNSRWSCRYGE